MIWKPCILYSLAETGVDMLDNPTYELQKKLETYARFSPWTDAQKALEGREVTKNEQRFVLPLPFNRLRDCKLAEIDNVMYAITEAINLFPRFSVIQVKVYKE